MINYDTIISNFDDKVTLYNWLRKVEEALKNASATSFVVNKKGNATLSFSITFADGETLESGDIVLQQGESVDQARIASGILQLHLTNGTWLTAGNIKPVSNFSIDANQHLIVNYQDGTSQDLGAIFNGNINIAGTLNAIAITGDSIIEKMSGYTLIMNAPTGWTYEKVYVGVVKNGNKVTFVVALNVVKGENAEYNPVICDIAIPLSVYNALYPTNIGGLNVLDNKILNIFSSYASYVSTPAYIQKVGFQQIRFVLASNALVQGTKYYVRYEATFLLNDSL